jgi:surfeit locus 1 family protein
VWTMARRPRWIAALVAALAIAAAFALLSQWQLGRAIATATVVSYPTEKVIPLTSVAKPQSGVTDRAAGQMVSVDGSIVPGDATVVSSRINFGKTGYWVVAHVVTSTGPSLALALGWAETQKQAEAVAAGIVGSAASTPIVGRYQPTEPPDQSKFEEGEVTAVSVAGLINEWKTPPTSVYGGYVIAKSAPAGLDAIQSPRPSNDVTLNWLNIFYSIEWVVFAGFAFYLWYRLVKDAVERERDEALEALEAESSEPADVN